MRGGFDKTRAARILVDAIAMGHKEAAQFHNVCEKTVWRYEKRLKEDPELRKLFDGLSVEATSNWHIQRREVIAEGLRKLRQLIAVATIEHFSEVTEAVRVIAELELAREALVGTGDHLQGPEIPADPGGSAEPTETEAGPDPGADEG